MLFRDIFAVYSENHTKPIDAHCGKDAGLIIAKTQVVCIVSIGL
jgi:hypothetical protein